MRIIVNGDAREVPSRCVTWRGARRSSALADAVVATALNGEFVAVGRARRRPLSEGDQLEVLAPMQGG